LILWLFNFIYQFYLLQPVYTTYIIVCVYNCKPSLCIFYYLLSPVNVGECFFIIVISEGQFDADHFQYRVRTSRESRQYTQFVVSVNFVQYFGFRRRHVTWSYCLYINTTVVRFFNKRTSYHTRSGVHS